MRIGYAVAMAAFLAASPAMAQVVIGGDHDAARHEYQADQQRHAAQEDMHESHELAEHGDYRGAMRERREAQQHRHAAMEQERRADRDADRGGMRVEIR